MLDVGATGTLTMGTRGKDGPGEVQLTVRGAIETYIAYSDDPLPRGSIVAVYEVHPGRRVDVEVLK